jgi:phenylalanyl-tRNA synthetase alpha chain
MLLICPGLVYRRDTIDRLHTGEPHQLDLWRLKRGRLTIADLHEMIHTVVQAALPGYLYRVTPARHPYTTDGLQIDVACAQEWVEIGECGLAAPAVLAQAGLETTHITGLAMGLGLDRLVMLRKGIHDIRLLRADDARIARQMLDLAPYVSVSRQPPMHRDLSVAVEQESTAEELGDRIREVLADRVTQLESVDILSTVLYENLPAAAHARMGMQPGQKNVLLRLVIRDPVRTLTRAEANDLRDTVYRAIHQGGRLELSNA